MVIGCASILLESDTVSRNAHSEARWCDLVSGGFSAPQSRASGHQSTSQGIASGSERLLRVRRQHNVRLNQRQHESDEAANIKQRSAIHDYQEPLRMHSKDDPLRPIRLASETRAQRVREPTGSLRNKNRCSPGCPSRAAAWWRCASSARRTRK